ncbi:MAG: DUF6079 family protein [Terriglobia bacterium]
MPPLIKDYVEFKKVELVSTLNSTNQGDCLNAFLPTDALIELLSRILESIYFKLQNQDKSGPEGSSIILAGGHGVGKSHLLAVIYSLIHQKGGLAHGLNDPRVQSHIASLRELAPLCIWIDLGENPTLSLPELVLTRIHEEYSRRYDREIFDATLISGIDTIKAHEFITFNIANERPMLLIIDGLSTRADQRSAKELNEDIEFLSFMGYSSKSANIFLLVAAHEDFFSPKSPLGIDNALMAQTLENFRIDWIDRSNLREIISRYIFRKNPRQQQDVQKLHSFIKAKLPNFQYSETEFCDTYPFHPLIFELAEKIKNKLPGFSLLEFVNTIFPKVASYRAISLVTIEAIFDRMEFEMKSAPQGKRLYALYQDLVEQAVPRLQDRYRLWGKMLLKAIYLFTLADRSASVRELSDALLLFEDSEGLSYNVVGMLLAQMEKTGENAFTTTDDRLDRTYRLGVTDVREELDRYFLNIAAQIPDSDPRLGALLMESAADIFPDWPAERDQTRPSAHSPVPVQLTWRGTKRSGLLAPSERFLSTLADHRLEPLDTLALSTQLPELGVSDDGFKGLSEPTGPAVYPPEWLLWFEPASLLGSAEDNLRPQRVTEIFWVPAVPTGDEIELLKKALAIRLTEKSASHDFSPADVRSLHDEIRAGLIHLFRELYLYRARIITFGKTQSFNQGHLECRTFLSFLSYLFRPNFDQLYSLHPDYGGEALTESHVLTLSRGLFAGQDPTNPEVQRLAGKFALPLGLVSQLDGLFELNLTITPPAFMTQLVQTLETVGATERAVESLYQLVRRSPFGLDKPALYLILLAFVADGQAELYDPDSNVTITRENLAGVADYHPFTHFRKIPIHKDYPAEILTQWCRLITGRQDLTDISTSRGREASLAALGEWLRNWKSLAVSRRLDALHNELLTNQMWRVLTWTKQRFEKVAEYVEQVMQRELLLIQGIGKIIDLFGENSSLLEKASRDLVEASHFIHWAESFLENRKYLLASEKTGNPEIETRRERLMQLIESPHALINAEQRTLFDATFRQFKELYIEYYSNEHDRHVGPLGRFELLKEVETSTQMRNLQLLASLPLGDSSYLVNFQEWITDIRDHQCTLPTRDLLYQSPRCQCSFKLTRPLEISEVVKDLKHFLDFGISYHRQLIVGFRDTIESKLVEGNGQDADQLTSLRLLLGEGEMPALTQKNVDQINEILEGSLTEEKINSPLPALIPNGYFRKRELAARIQKWLESLSDDEGVVFSLRDF